MLAIGGAVVNGIQTCQGMRSAGSQSEDTRVQAMAAATTALAALTPFVYLPNFTAKETRFMQQTRRENPAPTDAGKR